MKEFNTEVLIVGSGLVGLVAAYGLSSLNYKVTLVDKKNFLNSKSAFKDTRTVAISEGSKIFLESLCLWDYLKKYTEPIKTIEPVATTSIPRTSKSHEMPPNVVRRSIITYSFHRQPLHQFARELALCFA